MQPMKRWCDLCTTPMHNSLTHAWEVKKKSTHSYRIDATYFLFSFFSFFPHFLWYWEYSTCCFRHFFLSSCSFLYRSILCSCFYQALSYFVLIFTLYHFGFVFCYFFVCWVYENDLLLEIMCSYKYRCNGMVLFYRVFRLGHFMAAYMILLPDEKFFFF